MAHLVTVFVFTFYAVLQANTKSVKIAENTFLKAKRQQYTLGKVVHCLFNINLYTYLAIYCYCTGADPGFFLGGGARVSCSTSTPISHIIFFFLRNTSCIRKPRVISGEGGGVRAPCTLPLDPPVL